MPKPLWIITYDICCPRRLQRIQKHCASHGWALQKSFYLFAFNRSEREAFCAKLIGMLDKKEDRLLCLPFSTPSGSFHIMPESDLLIIHDDPRLEGYIR